MFAFFCSVLGSLMHAAIDRHRTKLHVLAVEILFDGSVPWEALSHLNAIPQPHVTNNLADCLWIKENFQTTSRNDDLIVAYRTPPKAVDTLAVRVTLTEK